MKAENKGHFNFDSQIFPLLLETYLKILQFLWTPLFVSIVESVQDREEFK
jgi:hypothetical protein